MTRLRRFLYIHGTFLMFAVPLSIVAAYLLVYAFAAEALLIATGHLPPPPWRW